MAFAQLANIQTKVRRLTRSPDQSLLTDAQLNDYINNFILYDFPSSIRLFPLRQTFTFYTQPNVDQYATNTTNPNDAMYNFKNQFIAVHAPIYLAGIQGFYTQWRDVFFGYFPQTTTVADTGARGNGTPGPFTGTLVGKPVIQNSVNFNCLDTSGQAMVLIDYPISNTLGALALPNTNPPPATLPSLYGQINYVTGDFTVTFPNNTENMAIIYAEGITYQPGKPVCMLYYNDVFTLRPVPDKVYPIQVEVDVRPTALIQQTDTPFLEQWWQFIALGAAIRIFQDKMDMESVNLLRPEYEEQRNFALRTTLTQQAEDRTVTIYTQGKNYGFGWFGPGGWPY